MCVKKCCHSFFECEKRGAENICAFFRAEHTPLEMGLLVSTAILGGIVLGFACAPNKSVQIGSSNGCANTITDAAKKGTK